MATTEILAAGTTEASSGEFTLAAGASTTLALKNAAVSGDVPFGAVVNVQIKSDGDPGIWTNFDQLNQRQPAGVLAAAGTFRVTRLAGASAAVGVHRS